MDGLAKIELGGGDGVELRIERGLEERDEGVWFGVFMERLAVGLSGCGIEGRKVRLNCPIEKMQRYANDIHDWGKRRIHERTRT